MKLEIYCNIDAAPQVDPSTIQAAVGQALDGLSLRAWSTMIDEPPTIEERIAELRGEIRGHATIWNHLRSCTWNGIPLRYCSDYWQLRQYHLVRAVRARNKARRLAGGAR